MASFDTAEPSHLPNIRTLNQIKYEKRRKELLNDDPFCSLLPLKQSTPFNGFIHDIDIDPFFVFYCYFYQIDFLSNVLNDIQL